MYRWHRGVCQSSIFFLVLFISSVQRLPKVILADFALTFRVSVTGPAVAYARLYLVKILNVYVTIPSYSFNARFHPPGLMNTVTGFPDFTKCTDRMFRYHDHKFE
ncbi:uncharacterized protein EDB93DRAFT_1155708 [Suillus bovinus]|uniref:uncharacterized protein n=1 Tax=Suillus bovinus TaxID=48563 RepID=UPI001B87165B|nr:uncharacterized protein EDB93DRAFT_1155708 [Suillus bovinus]KAG2143545.1 hypothetical protein EDB93DRAFT_1155708 [Suillus bovinus]